MSQYQTIAAPSTAVYKEKNSKFLAFAYPVYSEAEIKEILNNLKKAYFDARHFCYAYRLEADGRIYRANDDGEPSHTAGDPILGQLKSADLTFVLVVVVRYFGGIKLGVSGLIQAYRTAAQAVIAAATFIQKTEQCQLTLHFAYEQLSLVMNLIKNAPYVVVKQDFSQYCSLCLKLPKTQETILRAQLQKIEHVEIV
ncbi:IMPACT family protein [Adhaeribacter pallidiroseus]|uniref:Thymidylate synthase n=1 Tax=Adhaeribacter pallidiroseus TaxID=2072847 RepID=A0A369QJW9_9BACT|nr:YigZ family protein [Adhaeribacter pallidiroseus]RDC63537.1 Thymidylate synthase [Adhaeribacter pallidiroseus]